MRKRKKKRTRLNASEEDCVTYARLRGTIYRRRRQAKEGGNQSGSHLKMFCKRACKQNNQKIEKTSKKRRATAREINQHLYQGKTTKIQALNEGKNHEKKHSC